ncbi:hypothetical protein [Microcoleus anatoxicus]
MRQGFSTPVGLLERSTNSQNDRPTLKTNKKTSLTNHQLSISSIL